MSPRLRYGITLLGIFSLLRILPIPFPPALAAGQTMFEMGLVGEWSNYGSFRSVEVWRQEEARDGDNVWVTYAGCATSKGLVIVDLLRHAVSSFLPIGECLDLTAKKDGAGGDVLYLYVAQGETGLCCINVANPSHPYSVTLTDTPGTARGVTIAEDFAFVADGDAGLQIMNVANPARLETVGSCDTPGTARGVTVAGNHAFVADADSGLQVIDISNRGGPRIVGTCDTPGTAKGVAIAGDYVFVADDEHGIQVIDIADRNLPACVGACDTPGKARAVTLCGAFACVADETGSLLIIDVSSPHNPEIAGGCVTPEGAYDIAVLDDRAYVAGGDYSVQVIDISNKRGPRITGTCTIGTTALDVAVSGDYAYVAYVQQDPTKKSGLKIVNITDSAGPEVVGAFETEKTEVHGLCVMNDHVYLAYGDGHLDIIDVTQKDAPELLGTCPTRIDSYHVFVEGGYAYVTNWQDGMEIIDVSDPNNPQVTGSCTTPGKSYGIAVSEDYAYIADETNGLQVINVADKALPVLAGRYVTSGGAIGVTILGSRAFVVDSSGDLQIVDVSDPQNPEMIGHHQILGDTVDIAVASGYAYIADGVDGVRVFDVSDANAPVPLGSCGTPGSAQALAIAGDYAYAVDWEGDLYIIDVQEKEGPAWQEGHGTSSLCAYDVSIAGDYAFVTDWEKGMRVIRISDHNGLELVGGCDTPGYALGLDTAGEYVYIADWECGLQIIDVSDKAGPVITGRCPTPGYAWDVAVSGNYAFVTDGDLRIIDVSDTQNPQIVSTCDTIMGRFVTVAGDYAYVANTYMEGVLRKSIIQVIDVENRFDPHIVASYNTYGYAKDLAVSGDFLYVADGYKGLRILNVQDKDHPHLQGTCEMPGNAEGVRIVGDYAFISYCKDEGEPEERVSGVAVVDITNPGTPDMVGTYETQGHSYDIAVSGGYVYAADWEYGLLKLSIDAAPFPRGNLILVAGGGANPDNVLWPATQAQANGVFQAFIRNGYECHDIWYQNPVSFQDTDFDGVVNQLVVDDATPTKDEFIDLFTDWALASPHTGPLYIWLIGHGAEDRFQIMPDEVITAEEIKTCIDQFRIETDRQVVIVIESGSSVTFIDDLSGEGVIVITSAGAGASSIKPEFIDPNIPHGVPAPSEGRIKAYRSFTTALIQEMGPSLALTDHTPEVLIPSLEGAFLRTRNVMETWTLAGLPFSDQAPQMATPEASLASLSFSEDGETPLDALMIAQDAPVYLTVIGRGMDGSYAPVLAPVTLFSSDPNILDPSDPETISMTIDGQGVPWYEVKPTRNGNLSIIGHGGEDTGANLLSAVLSIEVFVDDPDYLSRKGKRAIIIAGYRGTGDYLWESTNTIANHAYRTLRAMGYGKHEISYYSPFLLQDLDGQGGYDDICGYPHLDALNPDSPSSPLASIQQRGAEELLLFLIDHGDQGAFCLNPAETLSSEQLIEWITGIADHVDEGITLIYDACYSGGFLRDIEQSGEPLAEKLVTITSTDPNQTAYYLNNGMVSFSYPFFDEWFLTRSLMDAFDYASRFLPREGQTPLCSDPNTILLRDQGRIFFVDESRPVITDPLVSRIEGTLEISAHVYSLTGVSQVWAVAESSRQEPAHAGGEAITEAPALTLDLHSDPNYPFGGEYRLRIQDPCPHESHYNLTIYAQDKGERPRVASCKIAVGSTVENNTIALILASSPSLFPPDEGERLSDQADRSEAVLKSRLLGQEDIRRIGHLDDLVIPPLDEGQTLFLYLIGMVRDLEEGPFFYLNPNERISPQGLESLLDPNRRLLILMDAPYSCQFLSRINWQDNTNWAGIASTPFDRLMFSIGEQRTPFPCFSTFFFSGILSGATVAQSLRMAQNAVSLTRQMPGVFLPEDLPLDHRTINRHLGYYLGMAEITGAGGTLIRGCSARAEEGYYTLCLDAQAGAHITKVWAILVSPAVFHQGSTIVDLDAVDEANRHYEASMPAGAPCYNAFFMAEGCTEGYTENRIEWEMTPVTGVAGMFGDDPLEPDQPPEEILLEPEHTLVVNALPIRRTFYCAGGGKECEDVDWIQFYGRQGHTYEIYAQDLSEYGYFIRLGLHDLELNPLYDLGRPVAANNYLAFSCPEDGYYLLGAQLASPYPSVGVEYIVSVLEPKAQKVTSLLVRVIPPEMAAYCARGWVKSTGEYISPTIRRYVYPETIAFKFNNVIRDDLITVLVYEGNIPGGDPVAEVSVYLNEMLLNEFTIDLTDLPPADTDLFSRTIEDTEYHEVIGNYISQGLPAVQRGDMDPNFLPEGDYDGDAICNCDEVLLYASTPCSPTIPLVLRAGINPFYFPSVDGVLNMPGLQTGFHVFYYAPLAGIWEEETYGMAHSNAFNALEVPQAGRLFLELNAPSCPVVYLRGFVNQGYTPQAPSAADFIDTNLFDPSNLVQNATTTEMLRNPEFRDIDTINCHDSRKGSWSTTYRFFGRVSGKGAPLDPYEVLIINRGDR